MFTVSECSRITSVGIITLVEGCTKLEEIGIPQCDGQIDQAIAALVKHCPALNVLHFDSSNIKDSSLHILQQSVHLTSLKLSRAKFTIPSLMQLLRHCLDLPCCTIYGHPAPAPARAAVFPSFNSLEKIDCWMCSELSDADCIALIMQCPTITELYFDSCTNLSDASIVAVASHCRKLQVLDISQTSISYDAAVCAIAKGCPDLRHLDVSYCPAITDVSVVEILMNCRLLREINLQGCKQVTYAILQSAVLYGAHLRKIDFSRYWNSQSYEMKKFKQAKPHCVCLFK